MSWEYDSGWAGTAIEPLCSICRNVITQRLPNRPNGEYIGVHHRNMQSFQRSSQLPCIICTTVWAECASNTKYNIIMNDQHGYVTRWEMQDYDDATEQHMNYPNAVVLTIIIPRHEIRAFQGVGAEKDILPLCSFVLVPAAGRRAKSVSS